MCFKWWDRNRTCLKALGFVCFVILQISFILFVLCDLTIPLMAMGMSYEAAGVISLSLAGSGTVIAALVVIWIAIKRFSAGNALTKASVLQIVFATFVAAVLSLPEAFSRKIPTHGIFLEITLAEWLILLWVPLGTLLLANRDTPRRWWCYFGVIAFLLPRFTFWELIFTEYYSGRRPWIPSETPFAFLKFIIWLVYFSLAPLVASVLKGRIQNQGRWAEGQTRGIRVSPGIKT